MPAPITGPDGKDTYTLAALRKRKREETADLSRTCWFLSLFGHVSWILFLYATFYVFFEGWGHWAAIPSGLLLAGCFAGSVVCTSLFTLGAFAAEQVVADKIDQERKDGKIEVIP